MDGLDRLAAKITEELRRMAATAGVAEESIGFSSLAWEIIMADNPDPQNVDYWASKRALYLEVLEATRRLSAALEKLSYDERCYICFGHDEMMTLRLAAGSAASLAERYAPPKRQGRKPNQAAMNVATKAIFAFEETNDRTATITVDPLSGQARGDFLRFVEFLFGVLGIDASAEYYARRALETDRARQVELETDD